MEIKEASDYAKKTVEAKKLIGKLSSHDEMIVLLYKEIERLNEKCMSLQEEIIHYAERT